MDAFLEIYRTMVKLKGCLGRCYQSESVAQNERAVTEEFGEYDAQFSFLYFKI